jgi:hypothetical protein
MRARDVLCLALLATVLPGCFRLSDPFYAFKSLSADAPESPGEALVFGTIECTGTWTSIDTVHLRRVRPFPADGLVGTTEALVYRAFRNRTMKDGNFTMTLAPGVYEVVLFTGGHWGNAASFHLAEDVQRATRFQVTRPGVYDLGIVTVETSAFSSRGTMSFRRGGDDPARRSTIQKVAEGTEWERYLATERGR